jgi:hypothetical protein
VILLAMASCDDEQDDEALQSIAACVRLAAGGFRDVPDDRADRFLGKVQEDTARCRGGERAVAGVRRNAPWVDWPQYWGAGDGSTRVTRYDEGGLRRAAGGLAGKLHLEPNLRGIDGALIDLEYARVELIKFNLFDQYTYQTYVRGGESRQGPVARTWPEMRLPASHPDYAAVGGDSRQRCGGQFIRHRTLSGICNDIDNPLMGSSGTLFARNVQFEETFPDLGAEPLTRARHNGRIGLLEPDPQVISRRLFTREQRQPELCNAGSGLPDYAPDAQCDYVKAPFFNVLAAYWIQFMTHDWFSHLQEGENDRSLPLQSAGCAFDSDEAAAEVGCRRGDQIEPALVADASAPARFSHQDRTYLKRAPRTFANSVTAWWDASQIYGHDEVSRRRVKRDPDDPARLQMRPIADADGDYLPFFETGDPIHPAWSGQEAAAFPDNWTLGMSFYHNVFAREHNAFVDAFRAQAGSHPAADSGLRDPDRPGLVISNRDVTDDELFEAARLVVAAEIAKIHTIEWTTQLLYDEPLYRGMNANWNGLFGDNDLVDEALGVVVGKLGRRDDARVANSWYSVLAAGSGIVGLGSQRFADKGVFSRLGGGRDIWSIDNPEHVNGGVNHFGSPFNFPEEFTTVYRLHPLVPDLLEYRSTGNPDVVRLKVPALHGFRAQASDLVREHGLADWALSLGRQRLGALTLGNHATVMQNLPLPRLGSATGQIDLAALDLIRDRERGVPRFNEFRRQYGLRQLRGFDDFIDGSLAEDDPERQRQARLAATLRDVYGTHVCDASKVISHAQRNADGSFPTDCLGHPDGTRVDNVEDLDTVVGWLAEPLTVRPHGYAISETQFVVFILNASRRLFSDRFFTSSFRPEFYTTLGHQWVMNNGPDGVVMEQGAPNGHEQPVSPMKRVLLRTVPQLAGELDSVVNVFDPWARDRGAYYSLEWKPRPGVERDEAFAQR